ncbi:hypothetical protein B0T21DRAFT_420833 [Apiosordaria backusii]|uniref:F-box domain-containing protein n=1 Tax=Apiosordaria backusii TaxID=314023 RepID=A0AA40F027_9PEZI|nr:hypothetical protein B0T21DRAFT_420833 [Apiosordaria backusii]
MADSTTSHTTPDSPASSASEAGSLDVHPGNDVVEQFPVLQHKSKGRQMLLRGLQRISSSQSLRARITRPRASSVPYRSSASSLSCVSLTSTPSPFGQPSSSSSYFSFGDVSTAPTSVAATPGIETPGYDGIESVLAVRKVEHPVPTPMTISLPTEIKKKAKVFNFWDSIPNEIKIHVLSFLSPKELVQVSRVSKKFHELCFDGQLWTEFDASNFYKEIPAESLTKILETAGPFVHDLNLRGCLQIEHMQRAQRLVKACHNLYSTTLEGCRNFQRPTLHTLLKTNKQLVHINLTGLPAVNNATCKIISRECPQLETLNVSGCKQMDARGIRFVIEGCPKLRDLRASSVRGFSSNADVATAIFQSNNLEKLILSNCSDLTDDIFTTMILGPNPEFDLLSNRPLSPPRKLRHLDLTRCVRLSDQSIKHLAYMTPHLEGLSLSNITLLTDSSLEPILASCPNLTHLDLEDLSHLTNSLFVNHLSKSPCSTKLEHLSISACENISDTGMLPVFQSCTNLKSVLLDNTRISNLTLTEAADMVRSRSLSHRAPSPLPEVTLHLTIYDTPLVTWTGILEILSRNSEPLTPKPAKDGVLDIGGGSTGTKGKQVINLKCFHTWQMTVDEHTRRVLRGELNSAKRVERKWAEYMQAEQEMEAGGGRRRRRRAREMRDVLEQDQQRRQGGQQGQQGGDKGRRDGGGGRWGTARVNVTSSDWYWTQLVERPHKIVEGP